MKCKKTHFLILACLTPIFYIAGCNDYDVFETTGKVIKTEKGFEVGVHVSDFEFRFPLRIMMINNLPPETLHIPIAISHVTCNCGRCKNLYKIDILDNPYVIPHELSQFHGYDNKTAIMIALITIRDNLLSYSTRQLEVIKPNRFLTFEEQQEMLGFNLQSQADTKEIETSKQIIEY